MSSPLTSSLSTGTASNPSVCVSCPSAGLDIGPMANDSSLASEVAAGGGGRGHRLVQEEPLDAILSPELDKMVTDGEWRLPLGLEETLRGTVL